MKINTVACLGDSITRGNVSYNWVKALSAAYPHIHFKNFGINGNLAYNALQRLDPIINCKPELVFILLGTNDVNATLSEAGMRRYIRSNKLPQKPDKDWYTTNMEQIINQLQQKTSAKIVLISLPFLGEDLAAIPNQKVRAYNLEIKALQQKYETDFIDLYQAMEQAYQALPNPAATPLPEGLGTIIKAIARRYFLFQSWDKIGKIYKMQLLSDGIHLNETSGLLLENLIKEKLNSYKD